MCFILSSASYTSGYNNGNTAGYNRGVTEADNRVNVNSVNYQNGYNAGKAAGGVQYIDQILNYGDSVNLGKICILSGNAKCTSGEVLIAEMYSSIAITSSGEFLYKGIVFPGRYTSGWNSDISGMHLNTDHTITIENSTVIPVRWLICYTKYVGDYWD